MSQAIISMSVVKSKKRVRKYETYVDGLSKLDLMAEFMDQMEDSTGKTYNLEEALNVKYLMERLLSVTDVDSFKFQLRRSLTVLDGVIHSLDPYEELVSC